MKSKEEPKLDTLGKQFYETADMTITVKRQETIEEAGIIAAGICEHLDAKEQVLFIAGFIESAKWQAERMYSEGEVLEILNDCRGENPINIDKWFEQFKKK